MLAYLHACMLCGWQWLSRFNCYCETRATAGICLEFPGIICAPASAIISHDSSIIHSHFHAMQMDLNYTPLAGLYKRVWVSQTGAGLISSNDQQTHKGGLLFVWVCELN